MRVLSFVVIAVLVLGSAGYLLKGALFREPPAPIAGNVTEVAADMSGFDKKEITVKAGVPVTVRLILGSGVAAMGLLILATV